MTLGSVEIGTSKEIIMDMVRKLWLATSHKKDNKIKTITFFTLGTDASYKGRDSHRSL